MKLRVLAALVFMLALVACGGADGASETADTADGDVTQGTTAAVEAGDTDADQGVGTVDAALEGSAGAGGDDAAREEVAVEDADQPEEPGVAPLPDAPPVRTGDRIIKEGAITIEVEADGFDQAYTRVVAAARRYQGDVIGSTTRTSDNGDTFGSVTVRVPVANFEDLIVGVGDIGTIRDRNIDAEDVSAEFTDLESRLRHLRAQERFYLGLLDEAETVRDAIAVQQQLDGIQSQIEQLQGRLNFLDDRTSFSTLTVELFEPGAGSSLVAEDAPPTRPSLAHYWETARDAFVNVIGAMLVAGLFALPLLIVAGALWFGFRTLSRPAARPRPEPQREEPDPVGADH